MNHSLQVGLIEGWSANDRPQIKHISMPLLQAGFRPHSTHLFYKYISTGQPACGNPHAGQGRKRIVTSEPDGDAVRDYSQDIDLRELLKKALPRLGRKVLISAGHFMPDKASGFLDVNQHSLTSLTKGLKLIQQLSERGIESDLLITINDVTVTDDNEAADSAATLGCEERRAFYLNFALPVNYVALIHEYGRRCQFKTICVGENKLSERLLKAKDRLIKKGLLRACEGGYALAFDARRILEIAHAGEDSTPRSQVFMSAQRGISGRPKCVRACALLAALPQQLGHTGFIQFLPVCARNALEGFLIGTRLFQGVPYISVHATESCF